MTENILEFQNVSFRYEGSSEKEQLPLAVRDVSFSVKKGISWQFWGTTARENPLLPSFPTPFCCRKAEKCLSTGWIPPTSRCHMTFAAPSAWCFKIPTIRLSPLSWKRTSRSGRKISACRPKRSANAWTMRSKPSGCMNTESTSRTSFPAGRNSASRLPV